MDILEKDIKADVTAFLRWTGLYFVKVNPVKLAGNRKLKLQDWEKGIPDYIICSNGKFIGIELKTNAGTQSDFQKHAQREIEKNDGSYHVVRSIEELKKILFPGLTKY